MGTDLKNEKLQLSNIVRMDPVFRCLSNEVALAATRRAVALDWVTSRPNDVKEPRKLHNIRIVVVLEERAFLQPRCKSRLEDPTSFFLQLLALLPRRGRRTHIMLLDNLLESGVIDLHKLGEIMHIRNDIAQILLQHHELLLSRGVVVFDGTISAHRASAVQPRNNIIYLPPTRLDPPLDLPRLALLPCIHPVQLCVEGVNERRLFLLGPFLLAALRGVEFQQSLELVVVEIRPLVLFDNAGSQLLAELHDDLAGFELVAHAALGGSPVSLFGPEVLDD
jgi:hypothetical protein